MITLARRGGWALPRALALTVACAVAHIAGSLVLGLGGVALGLGLAHLGFLSGYRAAASCALLVAFGLLYASWGISRARASGPDGHTHSHGGTLHAHDHLHDPSTGESIALTPALLVVIYLFSPCAPLIPLLVYPAATLGWQAAVAAAAVFSGSTLLCMLAVVASALLGVERLPMGSWGRYSHAVAGVAIALTGGALQLFGA